MVYTLSYLFLVNIIALQLMYMDKRNARKRRNKRVRERTLLILALAGGGLGVWLGIGLFHHKTQHATFRLVAPLGTIGWVILLLWFAYKGWLS